MTSIRERALESLERTIRVAQDDPDTDPRAHALTALTALESLGWRPTEARPPAAWKLHGTGAEPSRTTRALLDEALERAAEAAERKQAREAGAP